LITLFSIKFRWSPLLCFFKACELDLYLHTCTCTQTDVNPTETWQLSQRNWSTVINCIVVIKQGPELIPKDNLCVLTIVWSNHCINKLNISVLKLKINKSLLLITLFSIKFRWSPLLCFFKACELDLYLHTCTCTQTDVNPTRTL
jgi:hypothetical protein